jgi:DNA-binding CsgD family transcriptional regulator
VTATANSIVAGSVGSPRNESAPLAGRLARLTGRQTDCLRLVGQGYTSKEIGRRLGISYSTVNNHLQAAVHLLEVPGRAEAARKLIEHEQRLGHEMPRQPDALAEPICQPDDPPRITEPGRMARLASLLPPIGGRENVLPLSQRVYAIARIALFSTLVFVACVIVIRTCFNALR